MSPSWHAVPAASGLDPTRLADFSLMSPRRPPDPARPDRSFGDSSGRAGFEAPRSYAGHHVRSDINEATQPPEVSKQVMKALQR